MDLRQLLQSTNSEPAFPEGNLPGWERDALKDKLVRLVGASTIKGNEAKRTANLQEINHLLQVMETLESLEDKSGYHKWYQPGTPYSIDNLPKHAAFFKATALYREVMLLGGNRSGKTRAGATITSIVATGDYPEWWEGRRFEGPTSCWAVGKTGQTTRDTVQEAIMGPLGAWGTGALPAERIVGVSARQGIPGALDTVQVRHVSGGISTIGFKSADQKPSAFYGTAKHLNWLDEPTPELVYNECLIRTMTTDGIQVHTLTPKDGLTRLLADYLATCDLLAGSERIKGLDALRLMEEKENRDKYGA